jgi:hypothetical protein
MAVTMKQAAEQVLKDADGPLKAKTITERALDRKLIKTTGKTPAATMQAQLSVAAAKGDSTFVRTAPGTYGLKGRDRKGTKAKA